MKRRWCDQLPKSQYIIRNHVAHIVNWRIWWNFHCEKWLNKIHHNIHITWCTLLRKYRWWSFLSGFDEILGWTLISSPEITMIIWRAVIIVLESWVGKVGTFLSIYEEWRHFFSRSVQCSIYFICKYISIYVYVFTYIHLKYNLYEIGNKSKMYTIYLSPPVRATFATRYTHKSCLPFRHFPIVFHTHICK